MNSELYESGERFYDQTKLSPRENYWVEFGKRVRRPDLFARLANKRLTKRSNCPDLAKTVEDLLSRMPDVERAALSHLFVGRTYESDVQAEATVGLGQQYVSIDHRLGCLVTSFSAAMELATRGLSKNLRNVRSVSALLHRVQKPTFDVDDVWDIADAEIAAWQDDPLVAYTTSPLLKRIRPSLKVAVHDRAAAAEQWIIAHELAHVLMAEVRERGLASRIVAEATDDLASVIDVTKFCLLSSDQLEEYRADAIALWLVAGMLNRPHLGTVLDSATGALVAMTSLARYHGDWQNGLESSHPGWLDRGTVLLDLVDKLLLRSDIDRRLPNDMSIDMPHMLAVFRVAFASCARHTDAGDRDDTDREPSDQQLCLELLEASSTTRELQGSPN